MGLVGDPICGQEGVGRECVWSGHGGSCVARGKRVTPVGPVWMGGMTQSEKCVDVQPGAKGLVGSRLHLYEDEPPKPVGGLAMAATGRK